MKIPLPFKIAFPEEEVRGISDYLDGINREMLLTVSPFLLGFNQDYSKYSNVYKFMQMFFSEGNKEFAEEVVLNIKKSLKDSDFEISEYEVVYNVSSLMLFEHCFKNEQKTEKKISKEEIEQRVFKAYLVFNQMADERSSIVRKSVEHLEKKIKVPAMLVSQQFHNYDLTNYSLDKLIITQCTRAVLFFQFLDLRDDCTELLQSFHIKYGVGDYKDYLKRILPLAFATIKGTKEAHTDIVLDADSPVTDHEFLDKFILNNTYSLDEFDYSTLRSFPLLKINSNTYRIIHPQFVIEMIYNGLYFKLRDVNIELETKIDLYGLKNKEFSEIFVLNKVLKFLFGNRFKQISGEELDEKHDGAPDYYVRNGNKIFLFESKDIMIARKVKSSSNYHEIEKELREKFYRNEKGVQKAIVQQINRIRKILKGELEFDNGIKPLRAVIYPVVVMHHRAFNTAGLNSLLNYWFQDELVKLKEEGLDVSNVHSLFLMDVDTLIFNKNVFNDKVLDFEDCLLEYEKDCIKFSHEGKKYRSEGEAIQAHKNSFTPFSMFLDNKVDKLGKRKMPFELEGVYIP